MKQSLERELKLDIEPGFRLPRLPGRPLAPRVKKALRHGLDRMRSCSDLRADAWTLQPVLGSPDRL